MIDLPAARTWWRLAAARVWLPTAEEMAEIDRRATASGAIPERALIEAAGREVAHLVHRRWPEGPVVALAGSGHNGADALVALRCLAAWGRPVRAVRCGGSGPRPDVLEGWEMDLCEPSELESALNGAVVLLDGILGTGLREAPRPPQAALIERANASSVPVVAVDGPSGADFSTGRVPGACVRARLTVCLGWPKLGLLFPPARGHCGDLLAVEIGFPPPDPPPRARAITGRWVREELLRRRPAEAHKGRAGYLALVAGESGMAGAAVLAARAAVRGGAGIVRVVSDPANREIVQTAVPEAVFVGWDDEEAVRAAVKWADAVAAGPGLGRGPARRALLESVLQAHGDRPVLLDADGLNAWAEEVERLADALGERGLLTPHPGELARLLGVEVAEVLADRPAAARRLAGTAGSTVIAKGAPSLVAAPDGRLLVSTLASPALAAGGTGDVLSGLCGAYLAAGAAPAEAAAAALFVSGLAAQEGPPVGRSSSDLPDALPAARADVLAQPPAAPPALLFAAPGRAVEEA